MPYAITLRLNAEAARHVEAMWKILAARGVSEEAIGLGYAPHLTIAVSADDADPAVLRGAAQKIAASPALPIELVSFGVFPGPPATIYLAPVVTSPLLTLHAELISALAGQPVSEHYLASRWVPHVTLAGDLTNAAQAIAALDPSPLPIDAVLNQVDVVQFRPVEILASHLLT